MIVVFHPRLSILPKLEQSEPFLKNFLNEAGAKDLFSLLGYKRLTPTAGAVSSATWSSEWTWREWSWWSKRIENGSRRTKSWIQLTSGSDFWGTLEWPFFSGMFPSVPWMIFTFFQHCFFHCIITKLAQIEVPKQTSLLPEPISIMLMWMVQISPNPKPTEEKCQRKDKKEGIWRKVENRRMKLLEIETPWSEHVRARFIQFPCLNHQNNLFLLHYGIAGVEV